MKMICCHKCGTPIISDETFLQNILDAMESANRRALHAKPYSVRCVYLQEAAQYAKMFKAFMHNLSKQEEAERQNKAILGTLREHLLSNRIMTEEQLNAVYKKGEARAKRLESECKKDFQRIYGDFESMCNRTKSSPTEREAFKHIP